MTISEITFSILKTTPLEPLTHDPADAYANVKPHASCTVRFADGECDPDTSDGLALIEHAFFVTQEACFNQLARFHTEFKEMCG